MDVFDQEIFQKVKTPEEKTEILQAIVKAQNKISCRVVGTPPEQAFFAVAKVLSQGILTVQAPNERTSVLKSGMIFGEFTKAEDKYLFKAKFTEAAGSIQIDLNGDIYKLQRRDDFRVRIPSNYKAHLELEGKIFPIADLSAGGCKVELSGQETFKRGDILVATVHLRGLDPMRMTMEVRHVINKKTLGLKFIKIEEASLHALPGIIMSIYRELFMARK